MATEKKQTTTLRPGDFFNAPFDKVKSATEIMPELASERDEYVGIWERITFDKDTKVSLKKDVFDKLTEMYADIKENWIRVPTQGFPRDNVLYLISGRQRRGLVDVMRRREKLHLDKPFPVCIVKETDVTHLLASQFIINDKTVDESFMSIAAYVRGFVKMNKSNKEIGALLKKSEMWISKIRRVSESPYLSDLVKTDRISLDTASDQFAQKDFLDAFREPTSHKLDDEKLKAVVEPILEQMVQAGKALSRNAVRQHMKSISEKSDRPRPKSAFDRRELTIMSKAAVGIQIPLEFQMFIKSLLGEPEYSRSQIIARCDKLAWISSIDFRSAKEIKFDKAKAAALNAANEAKLQAENTAKFVESQSKRADDSDVSEDTSEENNEPLDWDIEDSDNENV